MSRRIAIFGFLLLAAALLGLAWMGFTPPTLYALARAQRSANWFGMTLRVERGLVLDFHDEGRDHQVDVLVGFAGRRWGPLAFQILTFGHKESDRKFVPFQRWTPCAGCTKYVHRLPRGRSLECFRSEKPRAERRLIEIGCRSVPHLILAMYRCYIDEPTICAALERMRDAAFESLPETTPQGFTGRAYGAQVPPNPRMQPTGRKGRQPPLGRSAPCARCGP